MLAIPRLQVTTKPLGPIIPSLRSIRGSLSHPLFTTTTATRMTHQQGIACIILIVHLSLNIKILSKSPSYGGQDGTVIKLWLGSHHSALQHAGQILSVNISSLKRRFLRPAWPHVKQLVEMLRATFKRFALIKLPTSHE